MDDRSIQKMMKQREKRYIWLERKLKINLAVTTSVVAAFFLLNSYYPKEAAPVWHPAFFLLALLAGWGWSFLNYRAEYRSYQAIREYLDAFESGDYEFRSDKDYMNPGIHSQITEQLERLGRAFYVIKDQMVREKEGTKELVTDISHQIKTPVAAIKMSLELMEDADMTEEEKREFLMRARAEAENLDDLTETLFQMSRLEQRMIELKPEGASVKETLIRAVNSVYMKANEKKIEIMVDEFEDMEICHDVKWTVEAVSNVIENAVKYSPEHSRIEIRVEPYVSYVSIEVKDEGIGIEKREYLDIFKRFYRGKSKEVESQEGAGVGLYLVRKILEAQGGSIRVLRSGKSGSVFQMILPKSQEG